MKQVPRWKQFVALVMGVVLGTTFTADAGTSITFNGGSYTIPAVGDASWGVQVSNYLIAIASGALQKTGGTFTLTAETDFGATYGLRAPYFRTKATNPATTGVLRMGNTDPVSWRNAGNSADLPLTVNSSNVLTFNGNPVLNLALGAGNAALQMNSGGTAYSWQTLTVPGGGTGLTSGTSGGVPYFNASSTMASSGALTANAVVIGGGAGAAPSTITAGTADQVLVTPHAGGAPVFGQVDLSQSAAVKNQLASTNGGTGVNNGGTLTYGASNITLTTTGATSVTLPTSGTLLKNDLSNLSTGAGTAANADIVPASDATVGLGNSGLNWLGVYARAVYLDDGTASGKKTGLLRAAGGSAGGYNLTFPNALPASTTPLQSDSSGNLSFSGSLRDGVAAIVNSSDTTKKYVWDLSGMTTGKTITMAAPATNNRTITLPDATDTLVGRATTDTLTNKTLTAPTLTTPALGTPASGVMTNVTGLPLTTGVTGTLPIGNGGTNVTSVTTAPAATAFAGWDVNKNLSANSHIAGYASTATAGATTTLAVGDAQQQYFTGSTTQTVKMPVASTLVTGQSWTIVNLSSGNVTVQSSGGNTIATLGQNSQAVVTCILTSGTTATSWNSITSTATVGTVTSVAMTVPTGFSISGSPVTTSGTLALSLSGTLPASSIPTTISNATTFSGGVVFGNGGSNLNWYEEGSCAANTPILGGTVSNPAPTYSHRTCLYTRIGRVVHLYGFIQWSAWSNGSGNLNIKSALPYNSNSATSNYGTCAIEGSNLITPGSQTQYTAEIAPNSGTIDLYAMQPGTSPGAGAALSAVTQSASGYVIFSCTYFI